MENKSEVLDPVAYNKDGSSRVKLKIPKEEGFLPQQNHHQIVKNSTERICHVCRRVLSSGKALGGHMRIHVQRDKNNGKHVISSDKKLISFQKQIENSADCDIMVKKKPICPICGRDFPSMKSLSGHLRCHPDRGWKGIEPPRSGNHPTSSSLSNAELSSEIKDHLEVLFDYNEGEKGILDLAESLSHGWVVTARRGRKGAVVESTSEANSSSEEDVLLCMAAHDLMMLSRGVMHDKQIVPKATAEKVLDTDSVSKPTNKRLNGEVEKTIKSLSYSYHKLSGKISGGHDEDFAHKNLNMLVKSKKRMRKRVKLSNNLDQQMAPNPATPLNDKVGAAAGDKYRCDVCDRSFPTYQALGGHKSSHSKFKVVIQNSIDKEHGENLSSTDGPLSQVMSTGEASETCRRVLDFDLNEKLKLTPLDNCDDIKHIQ